MPGCLLPATDTTYHLLPTGYLLPTTHHLPLTACRLPATYYTPITTYCLQATCYLLHTTYHLLPVGYLQSPAEYPAWLNPERFYYRRLKDLRLWPRVHRFPRTMFTAAARGDTSRWLQPTQQAQ